MSVARVDCHVRLEEPVRLTTQWDFERARLGARDTATFHQANPGAGDLLDDPIYGGSYKVDGYVQALSQERLRPIPGGYSEISMPGRDPAELTMAFWASNDSRLDADLPQPARELGFTSSSMLRTYWRPELVGRKFETDPTGVLPSRGEERPIAGGADRVPDGMICGEEEFTAWFEKNQATLYDPKLMWTGESFEFWVKVAVPLGRFQRAWFPLLHRQMDGFDTTGGNPAHISTWASIFVVEGIPVLEVKQIWATNVPDETTAVDVDRFYPDRPVPTTWTPTMGTPVPARDYCPYPRIASIHWFPIGHWLANEWHHVGISSGAVDSPDGPVVFEAWADGRNAWARGGEVRNVATVSEDGLTSCYFETFPFQGSRIQPGDYFASAVEGARTWDPPDPQRPAGVPEDLEAHPPLTIDSIMMYIVPGVLSGETLVPKPSRFEIPDVPEDQLADVVPFFEGQVLFDESGSTTAPRDLRLGAVSWTEFLPRWWGDMEILPGSLDVRVEVAVVPAGTGTPVWQLLQHDADVEAPQGNAGGAGSMAGVRRNGGRNDVFGDGRYVPDGNGERRDRAFLPRPVARGDRVYFRFSFTNPGGIDPLNVSPILDDVTFVFYGAREVLDWRWE